MPEAEPKARIAPIAKSVQFYTKRNPNSYPHGLKLIHVFTMRSTCNISIVGCHAEGEVGDVIIGGVADVPPGTCATVHDKLLYFATKRDHIRKLLLNEPRGRSSMNVNLLLQPCDGRAAAGKLIMESTDSAPMSGSNTICTSTVLLETGMVPMSEPVTKFSIDTAAGLVGITAECDGGKCRSVSFDNVPAFVWQLDAAVDVSGLGTVKVDIA